jgi:hypothetical protein
VEDPVRNGRYEIIERVGRGGMGVLYRGRDTVLDREVALKVLVGDFVGDADARARFFREAKAAAKLQHRNIVTIFEFGEEDSMPYMVMEFLRGRDLSSRMRSSEPFPLEEKLDIVAQLCTGLHFAHQQGVVHRDIKPGNIWLLGDGGVKLLDFGIAKLAASSLSQNTAIIGTASYMSPEQVSGSAIDGRADVFSAGVVLFELLAGRRPFEADSPTAVLMKIMTEEPPRVDSLVPDLPPPLVNVVRRALEKDPAKRYQRAGDMAAELTLIRISLASTGQQAPDLGETLYAEPRLSERREEREPAGGVEIDQPIFHDGRGTGSHGVSSPWRGIALVLLLVGAGLAIFAFLPRQRGGNPPPPQKPKSETRQFEVITVPPEALVTVDGQETGKKTPVKIELSGDRVHKFRLSLPGYIPSETRVGPDDLERGSKLIRLETLTDHRPRLTPTTVFLSANYDFAVLEGSRVFAPAAKSHQFAVDGHRSFRLSAPEYFLDMPLEVVPGRQVSENLPRLGTLEVRTIFQRCTVLLNGRPMGEPEGRVVKQVVAGNYELSLSCPDGDGPKMSKRINVTPGKLNTELIK